MPTPQPLFSVYFVSPAILYLPPDADSRLAEKECSKPKVEQATRQPEPRKHPCKPALRKHRAGRTIVLRRAADRFSSN